MATPSHIDREFIGQKPLFRRMRRLAKGARHHAVCFPNSLLLGRSGLGKTHFARLIATIMGVALHEIHAGRHCNAIFWAKGAGAWAEYDVVFIDEIHRLESYHQEYLYLIIDRGRAPRLVDSGKVRQQVDGEVAIPAVTIIGATDQPGLLNNALRKRFAQEFQFQAYNQSDMKKIVRQRASEKAILLTPQAIRVLATAGRCNPRVAGHLIDSLKLFLAEVDKQGKIRTSQVIKFLRNQDIRPDGTRGRDHLYLRELARHAPHSVSLRILASAVGSDQEDILHDIEPWLISLGYVTITRNGRTLTPLGTEFLNELPSQEVSHG